MAQRSIGSRHGWTRRVMLGPGSAMIGTIGGLVAAACGLRQGEQPPAVTKAAGRVVVALPGSASNLEVRGRQIEVFNAKFPDLRAELLPVPTGTPTYDTAIKTMLASDAGPDTFQGGEVRTAEVAGRGQGRDLQPLVKRERIDLNDFYPAILRGGTYKGKLVGLTDQWNTQVMFMNRDLFERAGLRLPESSFTFDQWLGAAQQMTRAGVDPPIWGGFHGSWYVPVYDAVWAWGGDIFTADGKQCVLNSRDAVAATQWIADLWGRQGAAPPPSYTSQQGQGGGQLFQQGRIGMILDAGLYAAPDYLRVPNLNWYVLPKPKGPRTRANFLHCGYTFLAANAKNIDGGWAWVRFLSGPDGFDARGGPEQGVPTRKSLSDSPRLRGGIWASERGTPSAWRDSVATLRESPQVLDYFVVQGEIDKALAPVWRGEKTARQAADELVPTLNALLASL